MIILQWPRKRGRRLHRLMLDEGNIAAAAAPKWRFNTPRPERGGKIARTLFHIRSPDTEHFESSRLHLLHSVVHWFNLRLKQSFALLIFAVVIDTKQICSVGRSRSLSKKKPKVNFVDASSCESGMEISAALSRLSISFASQRNESTNNVLFSFPNVPRPDN